MAKLTVKQIRDQARKIIAGNPGGIRPKPVAKLIHAADPETRFSTIQAAIWNLDTLFPEEIIKPERGLFVPANKPPEPVSDDKEQVLPSGAKIKEADFYEPFAAWLAEDLNEATIAVPFGGAGLKSKWGTPDVIGAYKPMATDYVKFDVELLSAEIKIDPSSPVVAFGQAVAYRLFSTKTYIAMPATMTQEDQARLEALCMLFGVGLVVFHLDKDDPQFTIRMRAQRFSPDMFYVNQFAHRLSLHDRNVFQQLFG